MGGLSKVSHHYPVALAPGLPPRTSASGQGCGTPLLRLHVADPCQRGTPLLLRSMAIFLPLVGCSQLGSLTYFAPSTEPLGTNAHTHQVDCYPYIYSKDLGAV
jgi:hypothetical protein